MSVNSFIPNTNLPAIHNDLYYRYNSLQSGNVFKSDDMRILCILNNKNFVLMNFHLTNLEQQNKTGEYIPSNNFFSEVHNKYNYFQNFDSDYTSDNYCLNELNKLIINNLFRAFLFQNKKVQLKASLDKAKKRFKIKTNSEVSFNEEMIVNALLPCNYVSYPLISIYEDKIKVKINGNMAKYMLDFSLNASPINKILVGIFKNDEYSITEAECCKLPDIIK